MQYPKVLKLGNHWTLEILNLLLPEHDDSDWSVFNTQISEKPKTALESVFTKGSFAEDGAFWLRKTFDLKNPYAFSHFVVEGGIDDFDYTYLNGKQIGQGFSCCTGRSYEIPAGLLKKEGNVLAIRVIDTGWGKWIQGGGLFSR
jgi:sialate O-acetylesterase